MFRNFITLNCSKSQACNCFREYLATFKKTVAMHEVFLQRIAAHPILRNDTNFKVFLEYEQEVKIIVIHV